jgi:dihydrofolate reductase
VEDHGYDAFMASVDALVMGRNTHETVLGLGEWPSGTRPVFVLSRRALETISTGAVVERLSGEPAEIVGHLAERGFESLYVDGGRTVQAFVRAGLIQRLIVTRVPVLLGAGIPLFGPVPQDVVVRHVTTRAFDSGLVQSEYAVGR